MSAPWPSWRRWLPFGRDVVVRKPGHRRLVRERDGLDARHRRDRLADPLVERRTRASVEAAAAEVDADEGQLPRAENPSGASPQIDEAADGHADADQDDGRNGHLNHDEDLPDPRLARLAGGQLAVDRA